MEHQEYNVKIAWLKRSKLAKAAERRLYGRLCEERSKSFGVSAMSGTRSQTMRGQSGVERTAERIARAESELAAQTHRRKRLYVETMRAIVRLPDQSQRQVLRYRYIDGMRMEEIAERMEISLRWAKRLHKQAVLLLDTSPSMC